MFLDKENPTIDELVYWFQVNFTELANEMKASNHNAVCDEPNPYHIEDTVWTHTMMVCQRAEIEDAPKINKICALLHDIGKPEAREILPFNKPKPVYTESNELRNNGKNNGEDSGLNRKVPKSGLKSAFRGHEGISFYRAIEVVNALEEEGVLDLEEKQDVLTIISMHGTLFDNITADGEIKKKEKVFDKFQKSEKGLSLFENFVTQVRCDSLGRFFVSKDGRKNNAYGLGNKIFTRGQFARYVLEQGYPDNLPKNNFSSYITLLIGVPASGKSTYLEKNLKSEIVISRDNTLMKYANNHQIRGNYSEVWEKLSDDDQKTIDKILMNEFKKAVKERKDIIVDMTNMSRKSRRKWINTVPKCYKKKAIIFATEYDEIYARNEKRFQETGKNIPDFVISNMMKGFMIPDYSEADIIEWVF